MNPNYPPGDDPPDLLGLRKAKPEAAPVEAKMDALLAIALLSIENNSEGEEG